MFNTKKIVLKAYPEKIKFKIYKDLKWEDKLQFTSAFLRIMRDQGLSEKDLQFCLDYSKNFDKVEV